MVILGQRDFFPLDGLILPALLISSLKSNFRWFIQLQFTLLKKPVHWAIYRSRLLYNNIDEFKYRKQYYYYNPHCHFLSACWNIFSKLPTLVPLTLDCLFNFVRSSLLEVGFGDLFDEGSTSGVNFAFYDVIFGLKYSSNFLF